MPKKAKSGSKTGKKKGYSTKSGKKLYYGLSKTPKGKAKATAPSSLRNKQVRRYGEYEVPHRIMSAYLKAHHMPPANYSKSSKVIAKAPKAKKAPVKRVTRAKTSGSKTSKRAPSAYNKFMAEKRKAGMSMAEVGAAWRAMKK